MTSRRKKWLVVTTLGFVAAAGGLFVAASILAKRVEPYIREQAIQYLRKRFDSEVGLARLQVHVPPALPLRLLFGGGRGALGQVEGTNLSLRHHGRSDVPPMFALKHFSFEVDLGALLDTPKTVNRVPLDGLPGAVINIGGVFDMAADKLDFHGALMLDAKVSETQTGWKRWVLKPVDQFFSKRGAGTFLHINVVGSAKDPQFGLDPGGTGPAEESQKAAAEKNTPNTGLAPELPRRI